MTEIPGAGAPLVRSITVPVIRPVAAGCCLSWSRGAGVRVGGRTAVGVGGMGVSVGRGCAWAWGVFPSPEVTPATSRHKPAANRIALTYDRRIVMLPYIKR